MAAKRLTTTQVLRMALYDAIEWELSFIESCKDVDDYSEVVQERLELVKRYKEERKKLRR